MNSQKGVTILETLIAIFIIAVGLVGGLSLAVSSTSTATQVKERLVAYQLAQEGIELVRAERDSGWLAGVNIFAPGQSMELNGYYAVDYLGILERRGNHDANPANYTLYEENGFYHYDTGNPTEYTRSVHKLDLGGGQVKIVSRVKWADHEVVLEARLFNWRDM